MKYLTHVPNIILGAAAADGDFDGEDDDDELMMIMITIKIMKIEYTFKLCKLRSPPGLDSPPRGKPSPRGRGDSLPAPPSEKKVPCPSLATTPQPSLENG